MYEIIVDTLIDALKLIPFLFVAFYLMELIEHKFTKNSKKIIEKSGTYGPLLGSILGAVPQCGFSVMATNLYATRIITLGTLISIYLSTSDEMLPLLISNGASIKTILSILLTKIVIGFLMGYLIDFVSKKKDRTNQEIEDFCKENHCDCNHSIIKSSLKHTINISIFILVITLILNLGINYIGLNNLKKIFLHNTVFSPFVTSLIGLIPNCASSVVISELYLNGIINFASCISGLLTGSGVALVVLFKMNKDLKENIKIISLLYGIGVISGLIIELINYLM